MRKPDTQKTGIKGSHDAGSASVSPLETMGISNPSEITRYTLRQEDNEDVLRIYYKRSKGSFLPTSKKYRFGRTHKTIVTDSGKPEYAGEDEISPFLQAAITELDKVVKHSKDAVEHKKAILDEIEHLEKYIGSRIRLLRSQIEVL